MVGKESLPAGETDCVKYDEEECGPLAGPVRSSWLTREMHLEGWFVVEACEPF